MKRLAPVIAIILPLMVVVFCFWLSLDHSRPMMTYPEDIKAKISMGNPLGSEAWATTWYACLNTTNISAANVWKDASNCTGNILAWNNQVNADIFEANGQTGLIVDVDPQGTGGSAGKVALKTTAGGGFTYNVNTQAAITINADITAGTTDCLAISGAGSSGTKLTIVGNLTGGGTATADAVVDLHTGAGALVSVTGNLVAGTSTTTFAYNASGTTGSVTINGNSTAGASSPSFVIAAGNTLGTINGNCIGSDIGNYTGCSSAGGVGYLTVTGSIIAGTRGLGASGAIRWAPSSAQKYVKFDGGGTVIYAGAGLGSDAGGTQITGANTAAKVAAGTYFIKNDDGVYTQGSASGGGGGAWGF